MTSEKPGTPGEREDLEQPEELGEPFLPERIDELRSAEIPTLLVWGDAGDPRSVALLPGSFDPLTIGHAGLAKAATRHVELVLLVYSIRTLPKEGTVPRALLAESERVRSMVAFSRQRKAILPALASHGLLAEQVIAARERFPRARLFVVMGSDKVLQLMDPKWYMDRDQVLERLFDEAEVLYATRSGQAGAVEEVLSGPENERWRDRFHALEVAPEVAAASSREVRQRLARGEDVRALVPSEVRPFIERRV